MSNLPQGPRRIWLRPFYGFNPERDGYIGWTQESHRDRMLGMIEDGDLFMIYGASGSNTPKEYRGRVIGFLEVEARAIRDVNRSSAAGLKRKRDNGWAKKWTYAIPVTRAWRADELKPLAEIAPATYRPDAGRSIAVWNPPLVQTDVRRALRIKVTEVKVFKGGKFSNSSLKESPIEYAFRPSNAVPGAFGERTANYEDGPMQLYLARFEGEELALLASRKGRGREGTLVKIGISNDTKRRVKELNSGFPPSSIGKWKIKIVSAQYDNRKAAEAAEKKFKRMADKELHSEGREFFFGDWDAARRLFWTIAPRRRS